MPFHDMLIGSDDRYRGFGPRGGTRGYRGGDRPRGVGAGRDHNDRRRGGRGRGGFAARFGGRRGR
jgi:hypothetical protein